MRSGTGMENLPFLYRLSKPSVQIGWRKLGEIMKLTTQILILSLTVLFSCGGENETGAQNSVTPIQGVGFQNKNFLDGFDPSFESATSDPNLINGRRAIRENPNSFRIRSRSRTRFPFEITNIAAHSGSKSLRLFDSSEKTLVFPVGNEDRRQKVSPLSATPGATYRLEVQLRLPQNLNRRASVGVYSSIEFYNNNRTLEVQELEMLPQSVDSNNWELYSVEFTTPNDSSSMQFKISFGHSREFLLDSFSLKRVR